MTITLPFVTASGVEEQIQLEKDTVEIDLSFMQIKEIDLVPIRECLNLELLSLESNHLKSVDLEPLRSCSKLRVLTLDGNPLRVIDFRPLASLSNLERLNLYDTQLTSIDLHPVSQCANIIWISLWMNQLEKIDLSPLSQCHNLKTLNLSNNQLATIDLLPLGSCPSLEELALNANRFELIDLSPLRICGKLKTLRLAKNRLKSIDLAPLSSCKEFGGLFLHGNHLTTIDLAPLSVHSRLRLLRVEKNRLQSLDLSPLHSNSSEYRRWALGVLNIYENEFDTIDVTPLITGTTYRVDILEGDLKKTSWVPTEFEDVYYERPSVADSWIFLHTVAVKFATDRRIQQDIIHALGFGEFGFIEGNLSEVLEPIYSTEFRQSCDEVRGPISGMLVERVLESVANERTTTGLVLDSLSSKYEQIASVAPRVLELRRFEIEKVVIGVKDERVDLSQLHLTAYGFEVLSSLRMGLVTDMNGLENVKGIFSDLGFHLADGEESRSSVTMSQEQMDCIWWIVEHRGKRWKEDDDDSWDE